MNNLEDDYFLSDDQEILASIVKAAYCLKLAAELIANKGEAASDQKRVLEIESEIVTSLRTKLMPEILKLHPIEGNFDRLENPFWPDGMELNFPQARLVKQILETSKYEPTTESETMVYTCLMASLRAYIEVCQSTKTIF